MSAFQLFITSLPSELHMLIFDDLDAIDATCLGLTSKHFYALLRRQNRNLLRTSRSASSSATSSSATSSSSSRTSSPEPAAASAASAIPQLRPFVLPRLVTRRKGPNNLEYAWAAKTGDKPSCGHCGIKRCELHRHVKSWVGTNWDYCCVREVFVKSDISAGAAVHEGIATISSVPRGRQPGESESEDSGSSDGDLTGELVVEDKRKRKGGRCWRSCPGVDGRCGVHDGILGLAV